MAPNDAPAASISSPPPAAMKRGRLRKPLIGRPGWVSMASALVALLKLAAVQALLLATSNVCAPAKRSRSSTCTSPERSTTATPTW